LLKLNHISFVLWQLYIYINRRSNIPCRIISGLGKDNEYYIGAPEQPMSTRWCAVYVDGEWRLVHVEWCMDAHKDNNQNENQDKVGLFGYLVTNPN